jgi:hypothetical protein
MILLAYDGQRSLELLVASGGNPAYRTMHQDSRLNTDTVMSGTIVL